MFTTFLRLGLTSFGGPIAHLGYFRSEFVTRRRWLDEPAYADLVALCQFLPGPASSQVGAAIGLQRAGPLGALAAWAGFTLPSAILLTSFALATPSLQGHTFHAAIHGLQLVAVAIVAQAVLGMARNLATGRVRATIAVAALALVLLSGTAAAQLAAISLAALAGFVLLKAPSSPAANGRESGGHAQLRPSSPNRKAAIVCLSLFLALLALTVPLQTATPPHAIALFAATYRAGALVFGGGHVVLGLLRDELPQAWIDNAAFMAGYGAAQAMPGPLFTFAAYLGAAARPAPHGFTGAAIALAGIFLPGMLILVAALPFWASLRARPDAQAALAGANAAVVGLLAAALYDPVVTSAVLGRTDAAIAATGFVALTSWNVPPWLVVVGTLAAAIGLAPA